MYWLDSPLLAQAAVTTPPPSEDAYKWVAGLLATALVALLWKYDASRNQQVGDWKTVAREASSETKANTAQMAKTTEALNTVGSSTTRLADAVERVERRLERIEERMGAEAPRRRT